MTITLSFSIAYQFDVSKTILSRSRGKRSKMEFYGLLKNQSNVRKGYRHLYNCIAFQKYIPPMNAFFKIFWRMCFTKIRINKEMHWIQETRAPTQKEGKGTSRTMARCQDDSLVTGIEGNQSRSHQVRRPWKGFYQRRKLTKYLICLNIWIRNQKLAVNILLNQ